VTTTSPAFNHRRFERFRLEPMYTSVRVERDTGLADRSDLDGHAYDISEAGVRIELDEPLESDERVAVTLGLPHDPDEIRVSGRVVWVNDPSDDPAARRMAVEFTEFDTDGDRVRLTRHLGSGATRAA
jgi:Tfp pilus assembly protein PilZ